MPDNYKVLITYRNFLHKHHHSHVGLGVNGLQTARVLRTQGVPTNLVGVWEPQDIINATKAYDYTHCIVEAPWVGTAQMRTILDAHPHVQFVTRCHSQIGFLQVESGAINILREAAILEAGSLNFKIAGNSKRFTDMFQDIYRYPCLYLPNLYDLSGTLKTYRPHVTGGTLRIGSFGALRLMKNHTTNAGAALLIARRLRKDLEFHVSVNREENPGSQNILQALRNMFSGLNWAKLVEVPWADWAAFRNIVGTMDLCLQLSQSETFNLVTADAAAEYVPSVVSEAIDWVPNTWITNSDSAEEAARVGAHLILDPHAGQEGYDSLVRYNQSAVLAWKQYLSASNQTGAMGLPPLI